MKRPFGMGPTTRSLGDLWSQWLLATYEPRDDPPMDLGPMFLDTKNYLTRPNSQESADSAKQATLPETNMT